jgi:hypothetical protein
MADWRDTRQAPGTRAPALDCLRRSFRRRLVVGLSLSVLAAFVAQGAVAQPPKAGAVPPKNARTVRATAPKPAPAPADAGAAAAATASPPSLAAALPVGPTVTPPSAGDAGAGVVEAKTLDGGTHVFKFSELDIEGRLKSPQLVYFLRRVRAEFSAGDLGHRTFMREMSETRKESSF